MACLILRYYDTMLRFGLKTHIHSIPFREKVKIPLRLTNKHYAMKTYGGSGCIDPHILHLGICWR
jgi:hypothetical protein